MTQVVDPGPGSRPRTRHRVGAMMAGGEQAGSDWPVVALVASAGGVDALTRVLRTLPHDLPASVIALLHIPPDRESALPQVLRRVTALGVEPARDGDTLDRGRVLVAPPGRHVLITTDLRIALIDSGALPPSRPSADLLLTTLAVVAGRRAIAVVLSGEGHDGATGASAIHRFGGTLVATDEASSRYFSMPSATIEREQVVDHIVGLDDVAPLLLTIISTPRSERSDTRT